MGFYPRRAAGRSIQEPQIRHLARPPGVTTCELPGIATSFESGKHRSFLPFIGGFVPFGFGGFPFTNLRSAAPLMIAGAMLLASYPICIVARLIILDERTRR